MTAVEFVAVPGGLDPESVANEAGLAVGGPQAIPVTVRISDDPALTFDRVRRELTDEAYRLSLGRTPGEGATLEVTGRRSLRWALADLGRRVQHGSWSEGAFFETPGFAVRGVLEGFYGSPWSEPARLDMVSFCARNRLNTFMYSPKDDPYLRVEWRTLHTGPVRDRLVRLVEHCRRLDVDLMVGVSPGLSIRYSDTADVEVLLAKFDDLIGMGVPYLALLLDDIPDRLQHDIDVASFPDLARAHVAVGNAVFQRLEGRASLAVCPTQYWGRGDEEYLSRLGDGLHPAIDLFWTGRAICSPAIDASEAAHFTRAARRPPLYWDNYPVNDVAMTYEMHVGPYQGRDPLLGHFARGVLANAMKYPEASKLALSTVAEYLWEPVGYQPEPASQRAIVEVVGDDDADAMALFVDANRTSCLSDPEPHRLSEALARFGFDSAYGDPEAAANDLAALASAIAEAAERLEAMANTVLAAELAPWLDKFQVGAKAVHAIAVHASAGELTPEARVELAHLLEQLQEDRHRVFGDVVEMTLAELIG